MDAEMWHRHARELEPDPPEKYTVAELRSLSSAQLDEHLKVRRDWLAACRFESAGTERVRTVLSSVTSANARSWPGAKTIVAVNAERTVGKSTVVRAWARAAYRGWIGDRIHDPRLPSWSPDPGIRADEVPVVWINLQSAARIRDLNTQILSYFGYSTEGPIRSLSTRIAGIIGRHNVRVLIVDDANMLDTKFKEGRDVLDHLKHINTELGERDATMVLVGAELNDSPIFSDPQIAGRLRVANLAPFAIDTLEEKRAWQVFLAGVEATLLPHLPAAREGLLTQTHASRIWRRTQGYIGDTAELLRCAADLAGLDGTWTLQTSHLMDVELSERAADKERELGRARRAIDAKITETDFS